MPAGIRAGGQFTAVAHAESPISLPASLPESSIRSITNLHERGKGVPSIELTDGQLAAVRDHIDGTGDFSYAGIRQAAEDAYFNDNGYTPEEHRHFVARHGDISGYFGDPNALRRDIEQQRKEALTSDQSNSCQSIQ